MLPVVLEVLGDDRGELLQRRRTAPYARMGTYVQVVLASVEQPRQCGDGWRPSPDS